MWTMDEATLYIDQRLYQHRLAIDGKSVECSAEERWSKPTKYAVMKPGRKTALAVYDEPPASVPPGTNIVTRPGEAVRCKDYCGAAPWCRQWAVDPSNPANNVTEEIAVARD